ncbi:unnamed protein product [Calypogeia fissa]
MEMVSQAGSLRSFTERRPRVMLEWDSSRNAVVAPRSQVGISWSQASADSRTKTSGSHSHPPLVDAFAIPEELLELPNLNDILSVETWENCLTHSEREILSMYLPEGVDPESTVDALLNGENFHFGNPLDTWGEAVCAGAMHPDAILHRESKLKEERKAYSKRLRSYHGKMVHNLQNMKEIWEQCEDPEDFLPYIQRFGTSGRTSYGNHIKNIFHPLKKTVEKADSKKRHWNGVVEAADQVRDMALRPKAKRQKVNKPPEEGSKRLKIKPPEFEPVNLKSKPSEGPNRLKMKPPNETNDLPMRLKGGKVGQPEERIKTLKIKASDVETKRLKIKSPEDGARRPEIKPLQEGRKKGQSKPAEEETRKLKIKQTDGGEKVLQMKPSNEAAYRLEMSMLEDGMKEPKLKTSGELSKNLKIKTIGNGRKKPEIRPAEEGSKRLQIKPAADKKDVAVRPTAKRLKVKPSEEGARRLENEHADGGTKKAQIKMSDTRRKTQDNIIPEEAVDPPSRPKAKRSKVKPPEEQEAQRPKTKFSEEGSKSLMMKPLREEPKGLKMKSSEDRTKIQLTKTQKGGKGLKLKPTEEEIQRPKVMPQEEKHLLPRTKEKKSKVQPPEQGTKKIKVKHTKKGPEEHDLGHSDFEGEWFKKYVQVTMGPVSGQKLSKAIQSVQVTTKMFKDVKRRSDAGEEVHLDTLVQKEAPSRNKKASKKAVRSSSKDEKIIANFWRTVLIKDVPLMHARFMRRKEQLQKLAIFLASNCKSLWEMEVSNDDEVVPEDASPSGAYASPSAEYVSPSARLASPGEEYASPSVGEPSLSGMSPWAGSGRQVSPDGSEASPSGGRATPSGGEPSAGGSEGEASPSRGASSGGGEAVPSGDEAVQSEDEAVQSRDDAVQSGDEAVPSGDEAWHSGDEAVPSGDEAVPSGDDAVGSGDEVSPSEVENWGLDTFLQVQR